MSDTDEVQHHLDDEHCGNPLCHECNIIAAVRDLKANDFDPREAMEGLLDVVASVYDIEVTMDMQKVREEPLH